MNRCPCILLRCPVLGQCYPLMSCSVFSFGDRRISLDTYTVIYSFSHPTFFSYTLDGISQRISMCSLMLFSLSWLLSLLSDVSSEPSSNLICRNKRMADNIGILGQGLPQASWMGLKMTVAHKMTEFGEWLTRGLCMRVTVTVTLSLLASGIYSYSLVSRGQWGLSSSLQCKSFPGSGCISPLLVLPVLWCLTHIWYRLCCLNWTELHKYQYARMTYF